MFAVAMQGSEKQSEVRIKKFMTMMDSMTEEELNTNDIKLLQQPTRIARISRGAGRHPQDYFELLGELFISFGRYLGQCANGAGFRSPSADILTTTSQCQKVPFRCSPVQTRCATCSLAQV